MCACVQAGTEVPLSSPARRRKKHLPEACLKSLQFAFCDPPADDHVWDTDMIQHSHMFSVRKTESPHALGPWKKKKGPPSKCWSHTKHKLCRRKKCSLLVPLAYLPAHTRASAATAANNPLQNGTVQILLKAPLTAKHMSVRNSEDQLSVFQPQFASSPFNRSFI